MKQDYVSTTYDEKIRPKTHYPWQMTKYLIQKFNLKPGSRLLDIGCGRGDFTIAFRDNGLDVAGLDSSEFSVEELKKVGIKVDQLDIATKPWPIPDESIDVVYSKSVIEHLHNPEHFMAETYRVLKPSGRVITMTPDWETGYKAFFNDYTHVQPYSKYALKDLLLMFSFRQVSAERFYQLPILWKFPPLKIVAKVLQLFVSPRPDIRTKFIRWSVDLMLLGTGVK